MTSEPKFIYMEDAVSKCHSYIFHMILNDYINITKHARENSGNISGQRNVLKSASAKLIRSQMTTDFSKGGVLPPVVIGLVDNEFNSSQITNMDSFTAYLNSKANDLCIIDGMQRTQAMLDAGESFLSREIRVELWLSESLNKLIYRMLVLNTGQVPWTMQRQLEVVLFPVIKEIKIRIPEIELPTTNDEQRRTQPGKFQASKIIESFLVFGSRSEKANTRDAIAEEYTKLDFIESSSKQEILDFFISFLERIVKMDRQFCRITSTEASGKFKKGVDILGSHPALIGITTAFAIKVLGRPKMDYDSQKQLTNMHNILSYFDSFINKMESMSEQEIVEFVNLGELNYRCPSSASTKIGDQERAFFKDAFNVLIQDDFNVPNMNVCWGH